MDVVETRVVGNHQSRFRLRARMDILCFDHKDTRRLLLLLFIIIIIIFELSLVFLFYVFLFFYGRNGFSFLFYNVRIISLNGQGETDIEQLSMRYRIIWVSWGEHPSVAVAHLIFTSSTHVGTISSAFRHDKSIRTR